MEIDERNRGIKEGKNLEVYEKGWRNENTLEE